MWCSPQRVASQYWENNIKTLSEQLGSLQITEKASERTTKYTGKMSTAPVPTQENNR